MFHRTGGIASLRRPIVQRRRIEIRAVRPYQRVNFAIENNLLEKAPVAQCPVKLTFKDGTEINFLERFVIKANTQCIEPNYGEGRYFANSMLHKVFTEAAQWVVAGVPAAAAASVSPIQ